uniref:translation initiation factor IF-2-like isoform X2 n=1 Tax=Halichoerus grypus TaxID=9711 RepID=UPI0016597F19|nr:translation initiation factor IF-2-like isoform X2 [Halichoerus grypus]
MFPSPTARNLTVVLPIPRDPASWRRVHQKAYLPEGQSPAPRRTGRAREATPPQGPRPRPRPFPDHVGPCGGPRLLEVPGARDLGATPPRERSEWDPGPLLRSAVLGPQTPCRQSSLFSLGPRAQLSRALLLRQVGSQSAPPGSEQCEGRGSPLPPPAPCQGWARWKGAGLGVWRETGRGAFSWVPSLGVSLLRTDSAPETAVGLTPAPRDLGLPSLHRFFGSSPRPNQSSCLGIPSGPARPAFPSGNIPEAFAISCYLPPPPCWAEKPRAASPPHPATPTHTRLCPCRWGALCSVVDPAPSLATTARGGV